MDDIQRLISGKWANHREFINLSH